MPEPEPGPAATDLAAGVAALVTPIYDTLEALASEVLSCRRAAGDGPCTERSLAPLEKAIAPRLAAHPSLAGMGFVAAPGVIGGLERYLLWWQRSGEDLARLRLNLETTSVDVYDYLQMEWFQVARDHGGRAAFGPYVDYAGSGLYVVTASVPVVLDGSFLGVAGADIEMAQLERRLIAVLRTSPLEALVVGGERRVLASNTPRWVVGSRLGGPPRPGELGTTEVVEVPEGPGWQVVLTDVAVAY
ncbi:MAG TPA: cache domain-containing protein [Nocardioides sp.]|uniref:cache domain-containing protein n=1 Tax=Nocardioides sp. TaxID=35761 RepID=UPI002D022F92|nr:cache domain-containing protein [Nocardioides sp.]HQR26947.1 cache domain-containing protein [Nocardioides sp.]